MPYAHKTKKTPMETKHHIEALLERYGATRFASFSEPERAAILFEVEGRRIRFTIAVPKDSEQKVRAIWRALLLSVKAKLVSVDQKIETFEEAFMAHVVMPDGKTVAEHALPAIARAYETGNMPPLLPGPSS